MEPYVAPITLSNVDDRIKTEYPEESINREKVILSHCYIVSRD